MGAHGNFRTILTGATAFCFTSTSTATTGPDSAPAIKPDGPGVSLGSCTCSRLSRRRAFSPKARRPISRAKAGLESTCPSLAGKNPSPKRKRGTLTLELQRKYNLSRDNPINDRDCVQYSYSPRTVRDAFEPVLCALYALATVPQVRMMTYEVEFRLKAVEAMPPSRL